MTDTELDRKKAFFRMLEAFTGTESANEQHDEGMHVFTSARPKSNPYKMQNYPTSVDKYSTSSGLPLRSSTIAVQTHIQPEEENTADTIDVIEATPLIPNKTHISIPPPSSSSNSMKYSTISKATGERKRGVALGQTPGNNQVFKGLRFFFLPDNDVDPARRKRIRKAIEYGAEWVTVWHPPSTSHVIVDKSLTYEDVLKYLKISEMPAGIIMVDEKYPAACIPWGSLVDPTLKSYQVKGYKQAGPLEDRKLNSSDAVRQTAPAKRPKVIHEKRQLPAAQRSSPGARLGQNENLYIASNARLCPLEDVGKDLGKASKANGDTFQEAIASVKATAHLPLDSDEEDDSRSSTVDPTIDSSDDERVSPLRRSKTKMRQIQGGGSNWQQKFQCMQDHSSREKKENNPNIRTINILQEMENYYYSIRDQWRTRAYRQAIATLRKQTTRITTKEEAESLDFIGPRLAAKIEEISWTNRLQRLENAKLEPTDQALQLFLNVYGAGFSQASKWVQQGLRTLEDLLVKAKLTPNQRLGVEHYEDFRTRIPRPETAQLGAIVASALSKIDPGFDTMIGGSYRRGAKDSGDIDILVTKKGANAAYLRNVVVDTLVPMLQRQGFLVAALAVTSRNDGSKWHGACQLPVSNDPAHVNDPKTNPAPWRRIDLLLVPYCELGAAKIYFTGNDIFNRSMRLLARKKGMRLNQRGLYKDVLRDGSKRLTEGTKVEGESEIGIFNALGVPWREAWERNI